MKGDIAEALDMHRVGCNDRESLDKLAAFYEDMKAKGLAVKHPYNLPLVDTIGRGVGRNE